MFHFDRLACERIDPVNLFAVNDPSTHLQRGAGHIGIEMVSGQSAATSVWASSPLKILVPHPRGPSVWAYLSSFGGGLVAGDQTNLTVQLGPRTRCFLSTQASTKVYRNPAGLPCGHQLKANLDHDSLLVLAPDPVQAFAGSGYAQRHEFHLAPGSGLVLVDWLSSGRTECGERWAFDSFRSRNDVFVGGERLLLDSLFLDGAQGKRQSAHRLGRFNCLALVLVVGKSLAHAAQTILAEIAKLPVTRRGSLVMSASPVRDGALLRIAGESVEEVGRAIHQRLGFVSDLLQDDPWARKW